MSKERNYQITKNLSEKKLKEICSFFKNKNLQEFELKEGDLEIVLKATIEAPTVTSEKRVNIPTESSQMNMKETEMPDKSTEGEPITAPISGNFYVAPSPEDPPYVKVGDKIKKGDKICIIEAMKVLNEITSPSSGTVLEIFGENGKPVKQGETIFTLK